MSIHSPVQMNRTYSYSAITATHSRIFPAIEVPAGRRFVPIRMYRHASKWNSTVNRPHEPFTVTFDTKGMAPRNGVSCKDLVSRSAAVMTAVVVSGGDPV